MLRFVLFVLFSVVIAFENDDGLNITDYKEKSVHDSDVTEVIKDAFEEYKRRGYVSKGSMIILDPLFAEVAQAKGFKHHETPYVGQRYHVRVLFGVCPEVSKCYPKYVRSVEYVEFVADIETPHNITKEFVFHTEPVSTTLTPSKTTEAESTTPTAAGTTTEVGTTVETSAESSSERSTEPSTTTQRVRTTTEEKRTTDASEATSETGETDVISESTNSHRPPTKPTNFTTEEPFTTESPSVGTDEIFTLKPRPGTSTDHSESTEEPASTRPVDDRTTEDAQSTTAIPVRIETTTLDHPSIRPIKITTTPTEAPETAKDDIFTIVPDASNGTTVQNSTKRAESVSTRVSQRAPIRAHTNRIELRRTTGDVHGRRSTSRITGRFHKTEEPTEQPTTEEIIEI